MPHPSVQHLTDGGRRSSRHVEADRQDSPTTAAGRVALKFAAHGYYESSHVADSARLTKVATVSLVQRGLQFYAQLTNSSADDLIATFFEVAHEVDAQLSLLQVKALAYAATRHGSDACVEFTRAAIGELCDAAVILAQATLARRRPDERSARPRTSDALGGILVSGDE